MNTTDLSRIDVIVHTGPAEWWQVAAAIGPHAVILGLAAVALGCWLFRSASRPNAATAATKAGGWDLARWAMEAAMDQDLKRRKTGRAALEQLRGSHLLDEDSATKVEHARALLRDD